MSVTAQQILAQVQRGDYQPLKIKALARKLQVPGSEYQAFRDMVKTLIAQGRLQLGKNRTIRPADMHGTVIGVFRAHHAGFGFVRPHAREGRASPDIYIPAEATADSATGDQVQVRVSKRSHRRGQNPEGRIIQVLERATSQFVGKYFEQHGHGYVQVDGKIFTDPISVGDPGAKGARPGNKVVIEMLRFPTASRPGEAVLTELLGPSGGPGVDTLSIIREFGLPDSFYPEAVEESRQAAGMFDPSDLRNRRDFTGETIVTIDPSDARDFDDAIHLRRLEDGRWQLGVHIADVAHFVKAGNAIDREARKRGTSVYLPDRVLPMLPELISNGVASLQEAVVRYTKSVLLEFSPEGAVIDADLVPGAICVRKRLDYATVMGFFCHPRKYRSRLPSEVRELLERMRELAAILLRRRIERGFLELDLPELKLELDEQGRFRAASLVESDEAHQVIEQFMLLANETVARYLADRDLVFLRRAHASPEPYKLKEFAEFARAMGYKIKKPQSRRDLQDLLAQSRTRPDGHAIHLGLLRSMKRAEYSPEQLGHYAIAADCYCHFTSPIRRYPDLSVHRLLDRLWKRGGASADETELIALGEHCTYTERRAAEAEAELLKLKVLTHLAEQVGLQTSAVITSVDSFGFFAQLADFWIEGLVHVSMLSDDYYRFNPATRSLVGMRTGRTYRLGDAITVRVAHVDLARRQLDLRPVRKR